HLLSSFSYLTAPLAQPRPGLPSSRLQPTLAAGLGPLLTQAETLSTVVARTIAPIRLAGVAAALVLLIAAGALVARESRRELRLRLLRGERPGSLAVRTGLAEVPSVVIGTVVGVFVAVLGVRALGPTPELEPGPVRAALVAAAIGALAAVAVVGIVAG